jgi:hypothetical protein
MTTTFHITRIRDGYTISDGHGVALVDATYDTEAGATPRVGIRLGRERVVERIVPGGSDALGLVEASLDFREARVLALATQRRPKMDETPSMPESQRHLLRHPHGFARSVFYTVGSPQPVVGQRRPEAARAHASVSSTCRAACSGKPRCHRLQLR